MKKRGNEPQDNEFVSPDSNPFGVWSIPAAPALVAMLGRHAGDLKGLLNEVEPDEKAHLKLLFAINEVLSKPENADNLKEWDRIRALHEQTAMQLLHLNAIEDLGADPDDRREKLGDSLRVLAKVGNKSNGKGKANAEQNAMLKELQGIRDRMLSDDDEDGCQDRGDSG